MSLPCDFSVDRSFASLLFQGNLSTSKVNTYSMCARVVGVRISV